MRRGWAQGFEVSSPISTSGGTITALGGGIASIGSSIYSGSDTLDKLATYYTGKTGIA